MVAQMRPDLCRKLLRPLSLVSVAFACACGGSATSPNLPPDAATSADAANLTADAAAALSDAVSPMDAVADVALAPDVAAPIDAAVGPLRETRTIEVGEVRVDVVLSRPAVTEVDALIVFHGTTGRNNRALPAAERTLDEFGALLDRQDVLLVSVVYLEEGRLMGDAVLDGEAALLWVRSEAPRALGVTIRRVFLGGHSQGGYLVTRLNTMHTVDGVVANAPGPLDLVYRCGLEEAGEVESSATCGLFHRQFGPTTEDPEAYASRSLLRFTRGHRADLLVVQGMADDSIQMRSWPLFKADLEACEDCQGREFVELPGLGHPALFTSAEARAAFNAFLDRPR